MTPRTLVLVLVLALGTSFATADSVRPPDLNISPLLPGVPENCARFYSQNGWGKAKWDSGRTGELWVEKISADCTVQVVYAFGSLGENRPGGYARVTDGKIEGPYLRFVLDVEYLGKRVVADVRYEMVAAHSDGRPILFGRWADRSGGGVNLITLERGTNR